MTAPRTQESIRADQVHCCACGWQGLDGDLLGRLRLSCPKCGHDGATGTLCDEIPPSGCMAVVRRVKP